MSKPEDIIITFGPLGGLGDVSLYSTLAKRFSALGHDVYLDKDNRTRNGDVFNLFFSDNFAILGTSDRKPNAGYVHQGAFYQTARRMHKYNSIEAMERAHGLTEPYSFRPFIGKNPATSGWSGAVLVDLSAKTSSLSPAGINVFAANARTIFGR
jgi:hypothetical protein